MMNMDNTPTARQLREKNYYEQFAQKFNHDQHVDLAPIHGPLFKAERRPWNSYWRSYELSLDYYLKHQKNDNLHLLDFGCGPGDNALRFSFIGYQVTGFDISETNINYCQKIFRKYGHSDRGNFVVSAAENLPFTDGSFNVVVGIDILHHVDILPSIKEVHRVLKEDGIAIFREPVEVPAFDKIRNSWPIRTIFPNKISLESHITEDERKLNHHDLEAIQKVFPDISIERSLILSRFDKFVRRHGDKSASLLEKIDYFLQKRFAKFGILGGAAVIVIKKKKKKDLSNMYTLILPHFFFDLDLITFYCHPYLPYTVIPY